uniref:PHD-type domain-containing protein n=1 Tax=Parascaris univalens TaxID=6257 RepID=A0A915CBD3_PARUN
MALSWFIVRSCCFRMNNRRVQGNDGCEETFCSICLSAARFPRGRLTGCGHVFCFSCVSRWMKNRSQCPVCNDWPKQMKKILKSGRTTEHKVELRTNDDYENELETDEGRGSRNRRREIRARCLVCEQLSDHEALLICSGVVGHSANGSAIRCRGIYHPSCVGLEELPPARRRLCPFCIDTQGTARRANSVALNGISSGHRGGGTLVISSQTSHEPASSSIDEPGPSWRERDQNHGCERGEQCGSSDDQPISRCLYMSAGSRTSKVRPSGRSREAVNDGRNGQNPPPANSTGVCEESDDASSGSRASRVRRGYRSGGLSESDSEGKTGYNLQPANSGGVNFNPENATLSAEKRLYYESRCRELAKSSEYDISGCNMQSTGSGGVFFNPEYAPWSPEERWCYENCCGESSKLSDHDTGAYNIQPVDSGGKINESSDASLGPEECCCLNPRFRRSSESRDNDTGGNNSFPSDNCDVCDKSSAASWDLEERLYREYHFRESFVSEDGDGNKYNLQHVDSDGVSGVSSNASSGRAQRFRRARRFRESSRSRESGTAGNDSFSAEYGDVSEELSEGSLSAEQRCQRKRPSRDSSQSTVEDAGEDNPFYADSGDRSDESSGASSCSKEHSSRESSDENNSVSNREDWNAIDSSVLSERLDLSYDPRGRTAVTRTRKRKRRLTARSSMRGKVKRRKKSNKRAARRKKVSRNRSARAIRVSEERGSSARRRNRRGRATRSSVFRRSLPKFSLFNSDNDELPVENEPIPQNVEPDKENNETDLDLVGTILEQQATMMLSLHRARNSDDSTTIETEPLTKFSGSGDENITRIDGPAGRKMEARAEVSNIAGTSTRKNRPTRWGSPTTSVQSTNVTASIPLPTGPPIQQTISLEAIPIPNRTNMRPPISPQIALAAAPSSLNPSPSTSFALNAFAPPFGMGSSSICAQPPLGLSSIANPHLGQQHLLQLPPQMLPNLLMQPSFPISAVNSILAAGLLGNGSLGPPISQSGAPFVFGQVQMPTQNQQLTQQLANLASLQSTANSQQPRLPLSGVPPPPPVTATRIPEVDASLEPLTERIRQLTEANAVQSLGEGTSTTANGNDKPNKEDQEPKEFGGRKSASAEEEETSDVDARIHKNGPMFDQARHMLSESLKKAYKKKRITKDEYKEIMKKGVTALSQRTKLDEKKVHEYANKYIDCVLYRRKKKHVKEQ